MPIVMDNVLNPADHLMDDKNFHLDALIFSFFYDFNKIFWGCQGII